MANHDLLHQIGAGAVAGLVGTAAMQALRTANDRIAPETEPAMRQAPGEYMVDRVREALPEAVRGALSGNLKTAASTLLAFGYGSTGAALYSTLRREPKTLRDGAALGVTLWAVGYLGWLPGLGLTRGVRSQTPGQIAMSVGQHVIYGVATVAAYRKLAGRSL